MTTTHALPQRAPSTTRLLLRRMRATMAILALVTGVAAGLVTIQQHAVVASAGGHTAIAVMQAYAAYQALADANNQALHTIPAGLGPVGTYQDDIAGAEQNLERVAENNTAGAAGTDRLQLIEGLLPAYTGLVEQADAQFHAQSPTIAGDEDLWEAADLMLGQILTDGPQDSAAGPVEMDSLTDLESAEQATLTWQQSSPWMSPWLGALWLVPAIALLLTLAATQRLLYRRSRRMLNKYLTMAGAATIALCVVASHVITAEHSFGAASGPLEMVVSLQKVRAAEADQDEATALSNLIGRCDSQCSAQQTAKNLVSRQTTGLPPPPPGPVSPRDITKYQGSYAQDVAAAEAGYGVSLALIAFLTAVLLLLIPLGLWRYLDEYRYRQP